MKGKNSKISFASNICCVGYLLYKIITNKNPFTDKERKVQEGIPNFELNFKLKSLIQRCVDIEPDKRPSLNEIESEIEEFSEGYENNLEEKERKEKEERERKEKEERERKERERKEKEERERKEKERKEKEEEDKRIQHYYDEKNRLEIDKEKKKKKKIKEKKVRKKKLKNLLK